ncbi:hypothetical protein ACIQU5_32085 [Streptomyces sp. NPDC090306]|uniref:hypothetical protein n=1 Tax=Streptomyces sp. NPDC090306 TaxID=3365961 RepID=UPI0037F4B226
MAEFDALSKLDQRKIRRMVEHVFTPGSDLARYPFAGRKTESANFVDVFANNGLFLRFRLPLTANPHSPPIVECIGLAMAREYASSRMPLPPVAARRALSAAAWMAGYRRSYIRAEWSAILSGAPEEGIFLTARQQVRFAFGFLLTALKWRMKDAVAPAWRPVDWILRVQSRTSAMIVALVGAQALFIVRGDGLGALVAEVWEPCGIFGASLYALAHWLRRVRGIELAAPPARSPDE